MVQKKPPYILTKWVSKKYISWLHSEQKRLRKKGWITEFQTRDIGVPEKYRLFRHL